MKTVFLVQHLHVIPDECEDIKIIGIYSTEDAALIAIERTKNLIGFADHPRLIDPSKDEEENGFYIDEVTLDEDRWTEGYITV